LPNTNFHRTPCAERWRFNYETPNGQDLRFWVDVAYENVKSDHPKLTKRRLIAQILHQYQDRGDAMRYLDVEGKIAWKASPRFLTKLADAERDAQDELEEFP
jgi:hypothetical protein